MNSIFQRDAQKHTNYQRGLPDRPDSRSVFVQLLISCLLVAMTLVTGCRTSLSYKEQQTLRVETELGLTALSKQQWIQALKHFEYVLERDAESIDALRGAGFAYWQVGRLERAESMYGAASALDSKSAEIRNEHASILIELQRCEEARSLLLVVLDDVLYATPHFAEHNLAKAEACLGMLSKARSRLAGVIKRNPRFCIALLTLSKFAEEQRDDRQVISACNAFYERCEKDDKFGARIHPDVAAQCHLRTGVAWMRLGQHERASQAFSRCGHVQSTRQTCKRHLQSLME